MGFIMLLCKVLLSTMKRKVTFGKSKPELSEKHLPIMRLRTAEGEANITTIFRQELGQHYVDNTASVATHYNCAWPFFTMHWCINNIAWL